MYGDLHYLSRICSPLHMWCHPITLVLQIASSRPHLHTLGPKLSSMYLLGDLGRPDPIWPLKKDSDLHEPVLFNPVPFRVLLEINRLLYLAWDTGWSFQCRASTMFLGAVRSNLGIASQRNLSELRRRDKHPPSRKASVAEDSKTLRFLEHPSRKASMASD